ncbi:E3 SUMO-protein ligase RanBP2-like [Aricia agestis]|uniref:E3 SUMO-protein ligase RanBP2-like n=1 Tax=Aricia agestis TaxID=91739 RepID=UPI001C206817|nr:E3 SUMO-protein ligase RanBP2-like [Aricia agestis]
MYRSKKDVDKHVESLLYKLSPKDFKIRAYSIARLYYEVGDYGSCQKYVEQYLSQKSSNAAAHKLLGLAFQKLGQKEKALEQFKISLDIDPAQTATILDVCELLADEEVTLEVGRAKYWCEKAEGTFPKHPITFRLKERLLSQANPDPAALEKLLKSELAARPKDAILHARLLKHYLQTNQIKEACDHSCNVEFDNSYFTSNYTWYETLTEILKYNQINKNDWIYQLLLLTVKEKLCHLSLTEVPNSTSKNLLQCSDHLFDYDQSIKIVSKAGPPSGYGEFHRNLLQHHCGQLAFHAATYLLKKANKDQISFSDATKHSAPLMLIAWQSEPIDLKMNWLNHASNHQQKAARQWFFEGSYRCSQAGHYILANLNNNFFDIDQISQLSSGTHWRDKLFEKIFTNHDQLSKMESSFIASGAFTPPVVRLPQKSEVQRYDENAQRVYPNSLHHFVWMLLNYKQISEFKCTLFDMLTSSTTSCGPETLSKIDVLAFLYCATLTSESKKGQSQNITKDKPNILPANITQLLCSLPQMKWWDCAYKLSQNELGTEYTDIRSTLSRGIEVVRCIDNHGLDPELLCLLGRIFSSHANATTPAEEKRSFEERALLFYSAALPLLDKLKSNITARSNNKRMFDYVHKNLGPKELNYLIEESKIYVAIHHLNDCDYEKVVDLLSDLKSPQAYYHLGVAYKKIALDEKKHSKSSDKESKYLIMLSKAKQFAYKGLHKIKETEQYQSTALYTDIQTLIEETEILFNKADTDLSNNALCENESKYLSDECDSLAYGEPLTLRSQSNTYRNVSSTPKLKKHNIPNSDNFRTAIDSQILNNSQADMSHIEQLEKQIKILQHRDTTISDFMEQTKEWFQENRKLGNQIISTINNNIENTTEQFKLLRISVGQVKEQIDECRNECKDVADLKKQIAELKKEVNKLKKPAYEQPIDDIYNLEEEYRSNENSNFGTQIPFPPQQVIPPFAQRLMPQFLQQSSNPYLYGQNFYNLYNQFSQFPQAPTVPGAQPIFDPTRTHMNYSSVYPNPEQIYLDAAHLVPPNVTATPPVQTVPSAAASSINPLSLAPATTVTTTKSYAMELKDMGKSLPVNVVITSSDPLPTCTTAPQPVLSVTIPTKHIKGSPHNYQIALPTTINDVKLVKPPVYTFPSSGNLSGTIPSSTSVSSILSQKPIFMTNQLKTTSIQDTSAKVIENVFSLSSPNTSLNKSRTLSEKSNTSIENYDPCPDFKPIIPLPAEVKVTTGEEDEEVIFKARAKLFRFTDKQWKERGIGEMKLLKHKITGKVRVLMRREQIHKICANHVILHEMEIKPMKNETKAYFWCANDFAEETVILEKFCIRFKTADIAKDFYETFEKARQAAANNANKDVTDSKRDVLAKPTSTIKDNIEKSESNKTVVGGFTFSSTPTFKPQNSDQNSSKTFQTPESKVNVFSGITFKTNNSSLQNVFTTSSTSTESKKPIDNNVSTVNKLNSSDTVEEYEPSVDFKPVVPLPALIDQKTGEEEENIVFEHRAKLLRFDTATKEWKERGLGNIKILEHKVNKKVRLLMRREQIMKICCNHVVTKEMNFQKMPNMDKAVTWCAKDFSDGELVGETFCLRFKTVQACDDFINAVKNAQFRSGDGAKAAKEEENAAKVAASTCEPLTSQSSVSNVSNWGDKFKPKADSWECSVCMIRNDASKDNCSACSTPKDPKSSEKSKATNENTVSKFNFGIKPSNDNTPNVIPKWGDQFKPKEGTWECQQCLVRNDGNIDTCSACNSPKDPLKVKNESKSLFSNISGPKFSFGIPPDANNTPSKDPKTGTFFGTQTNQKFSFGIPQSTPASPAQQTNGNISVGDKETQRKPALLETPKGIKPIMETTKVTPFGENKGAFDFSFTPKTSSKGKSPAKTPATDKDDDSENEYASEDEGHHIHFSPVILVPDKIQVVTGEEDEEVIYAHRAKLYIFATGEWKERGIGTVKILKHKNTGKLRVLMRREQVFKICLNHSLTPDILYKEKDEKTWIFAANDFSDEELVMSKFCLRFSNKAIAQEFKIAVDNALGNNSEVKTGKAVQDSDDVVFVSEIQATSEEKKKAKDLMLPENFYTYKNKFPCQGCRGCEDSDSKTDEEKESSTKGDSASEPKISSTITPLKVPMSAFQSPANSIYGTPTNLGDKTVDTTIFRTPMQYNKSETSSANSTGSEVESESTFSEATGMSGTLLGSNKKDTLNTKSPLTQPKFTLEKSAFGESKTPNAEDKTLLSSQKPLFGENKQTSGDNNKSIFGDNKPIFGQNTSIFGQSKAIFGENKPSLFGDSKPIFGDNKPVFSESKPVFGENKPVFGEGKPVFGNNKPIFGENKPIFGENKPIFGENKPIFGENKPIFGDNKPFGESKPVFGENKPIFGGNQPVFGENKPVFGENKSVFGQNNTSESKQSTEEPKAVFGGAKTIFGENKSIFGETKSIFGEKSVFGESKPIFGENKSIFGENKTNNSGTTNKFNFATNSQDDKVTGSTNVSIFNTTNNPANIFSGAAQKTALNFSKKDENQLDSSKSIFGATNQFSFGSTPEQSKIEPKASSASETKSTEALPLKVDSSLSFAVLSSGSEGFGGKKSNFQWEGAGQPLFGGAQKPAGDKSANDSAADESAPAATEEEYDPHYEPIVPLPDEIVVTTGEEDEEKLFSQRCKLYRFDDKTKEWKERGVGELKILYHPGRKSYRLLQRREQVHKLVLNMLLFMDLELLPMKNSDRAWTWAGRNYADAAGEQETLAVRFKTPELATAFYDKVQECIHKLQVAAAEAIRKEKEEKESEMKTVTPLRMPKHLQSSARADDAIAAKSVQPFAETEQKHEPQVQFDLNQSQEDHDQYEYENYGDEDYNDYEEYDHNENSDEYYNEEEEGEMYSFGKSVLVRNGVESVCDASHIEVTYDQEAGLSKVIVTDANTGEILATLRIEVDTEFTLSDNVCSWSGVDLTTHNPVETTVKIEFNDSDKAMEFYDYCETSKAGTYTVENES